MNNTNYVTLANAVMVQHVARAYLAPARAASGRTIEGARITTKKVANRASVPADAITLSHLVEHSELGFSFRFRAVWHEGRLLTPTATHVAIEREWDDANLGSPAAVSAAINEWLQAVTP